ncbi:lysophospholipid acyltransferase family protein [Candidatus Puniceispirillum sp.]|nr:lysophospholipid acyltransferase family protein [Candidatus Puniceispirillum sp.]
MAFINKKIIDVEAVLHQQVPSFQRCPALVGRLLIWGLRALVNEDRLNRFLQDNEYLNEFDFIDQVFDELNINYSVCHDDITNIPVSGRVMLVANHPLGGLDGLALLRLVGKVRRDVLIVVNKLLFSINSLNGILLPVDVFGNDTKKSDFEKIFDALYDEKLIIIFPSGEVSRAGLKGIRDGKWLSGFLRIAEKTASPILPIYINARNSVLFYFIARLNRTLSMLMLPREMIRFSGQINLTIGQPIASKDIEALKMGRREKAQMISRHLRRIGLGKSPIFTAPKSIIHPVNRKAILRELKAAKRLGTTADNKHILLLGYGKNSSVMDEIGRLREFTFRSIGEGTGLSKDIDRYDFYYRHLILWDDDTLEIAGAYRIGEIWRWQDKSKETLYSSSLFHYQPAMQPYFQQGLELGRSFIQPQYWGMRSLDYLWQGIGAYLASHQSVRYLFGPVTLSGGLPKSAHDMIIHFYSTHFPDLECLAIPVVPYVTDPIAKADLQENIPGLDRAVEYEWLRKQLGFLGLKIPTLFKQYSEVCNSDGLRFCGFSIDSRFNYCVDGLVMVDIKHLKPKKRARYIKDQ